MNAGLFKVMLLEWRISFVGNKWFSKCVKVWLRENEMPCMSHWNQTPVYLKQFETQPFKDFCCEFLLNREVHPYTSVKEARSQKLRSHELCHDTSMLTEIRGTEGQTESSHFCSPSSVYYSKLAWVWSRSSLLQVRYPTGFFSVSGCHFPAP